ncbi:MAG: hypothetical protein AAGN66_09875 [Acidobacteriota bacterium]
MTEAKVAPPAGIGSSYGQFLALSLATVAVLALVGWVPTERLTGDGGLAAMIAAFGVAFVASLAGTVPVILARGQDPAHTVPAVMSSIVLRLAIALAVAFLLSRWFLEEPLLLWLVITHAALLVVDTRFAMQILHRTQ